MATDCAQDLQDSNGLEHTGLEGEITSLEEVKEIIKKNLIRAAVADQNGAVGSGGDDDNDDDLLGIMNLHIGKDDHEETSIAGMVDILEQEQEQNECSGQRRSSQKSKTVTDISPQEAVTNGCHTGSVAGTEVGVEDFGELGGVNLSEQLLEDITSVINADTNFADRGKQNVSQKTGVETRETDSAAPNAVSYAKGLGDNEDKQHQSTRKHLIDSGHSTKEMYRNQSTAKVRDSSSVKDGTSEGTGVSASPAVFSEVSESEVEYERDWVPDQASSGQPEGLWRSVSDTIGSPSETDVVIDGEESGHYGDDSPDICILSYDENVRPSFEDFEEWNESTELIEHGRGRPVNKKVAKPAVPPKIAPKTSQQSHVLLHQMSPSGPQFPTPSSPGRVVPSSTQPGPGLISQRFPVLLQADPNSSTPYVLKVCTPDTISNPSSQSTEMTLLSPPSVKSCDQGRDGSDVTATPPKTDIPCSVSECVGPPSGTTLPVPVLMSQPSVEQDGPPISRLPSGPGNFSDYLSGVRTTNELRPSLNLRNQNVNLMLSNPDQYRIQTPYGQPGPNSHRSDQRLHMGNSHLVVGPPGTAPEAISVTQAVMPQCSVNSQGFSNSQISAQSCMGAHGAQMVRGLGAQSRVETFPNVMCQAVAFPPHSQHVITGTEENMDFSSCHVQPQTFSTTMPSDGQLMNTVAQTQHNMVRGSSQGAHANLDPSSQMARQQNTFPNFPVDRRSVRVRTMMERCENPQLSPMTTSVANQGHMPHNMPPATHQNQMINEYQGNGMPPPVTTHQTNLQFQGGTQQNVMPLPPATTVNNFAPVAARTQPLHIPEPTRPRAKKGPDIQVPVLRSKARVKDWLLNNQGFIPDLDSGMYDPSDHSLQPQPSLPGPALRAPGAVSGLAELQPNNLPREIRGFTGQVMLVVPEEVDPKPKRGSSSSRGSAQKKSQSMNRNSASDISMLSQSSHGSEKADSGRTKQVASSQAVSVQHKMDSSNMDTFDEELRRQIDKIARKKLPMERATAGMPLNEKAEADLAIAEDMKQQRERSLEMFLEGLKSPSENEKKSSEIAQFLASGELDNSLTSDEIRAWLTSRNVPDDTSVRREVQGSVGVGNGKQSSLDLTSYITPSEIESMEKKKAQKGKSSWDGYLLHTSNEIMRSQSGALDEHISDDKPLTEIPLEDLAEVIGSDDLDMKYKAQKRRPADSFEGQTQNGEGRMTNMAHYHHVNRESLRELPPEGQRLILSAQTPYRNSSSNPNSPMQTASVIRRISNEQSQMSEMRAGVALRTESPAHLPFDMMNRGQNQSSQSSHVYSSNSQQSQPVLNITTSQSRHSATAVRHPDAQSSTQVPFSYSPPESQPQERGQSYNLQGNMNFRLSHDIKVNSAAYQELTMNHRLHMNASGNQVGMIPVSSPQQLQLQQQQRQQQQQSPKLTTMQTSPLTAPLPFTSSPSVVTASADIMTGDQFKKPYNIPQQYPQQIASAASSHLSPQNPSSMEGDSDVSMHSDTSLPETSALHGNLNLDQLLANRRRVGSGDSSVTHWQNNVSHKPAGEVNHYAEACRLTQALEHHKQQQQQKKHLQQQQQQLQHWQQQRLQQEQLPIQFSQVPPGMPEASSDFSRVPHSNLSRMQPSSSHPGSNLQGPSTSSPNQLRGQHPGFAHQQISPLVQKSHSTQRHQNQELSHIFSPHTGAREQNCPEGPHIVGQMSQQIRHTNHQASTFVPSSSSMHPQLGNPASHLNHHHPAQFAPSGGAPLLQDPLSASRTVIRQRETPEMSTEVQLQQILHGCFPSLDFPDEESLSLSPRGPPDPSSSIAAKGPDESHKNTVTSEKAGDSVNQGQPSSGNSLDRKDRDSDVSAVTIDDASLGSDIDVFQPDSDGETSLHLLCDMPKDGREKLASLPGFHQALNLQNKNQETALFVAVKSEDVEVIKYLLSHGADVNIQCLSSAKTCRSERVQQTALHEAVENGNLEIVKILLNAPKVKVDSRRPGTGLTPLMLALQIHGVRKRKDIVIELIKHGASLTISDPLQGKTPLMYAIQSRDVTIVEEILRLAGAEKARALVTASAKKGMTCLHFAAELRLASVEKQKLLRCIIIAGGDASVKNSDGETARDWAKSDITEVLQNLAKLTKS